MIDWLACHEIVIAKAEPKPTAPHPIDEPLSPFSDILVSLERVLTSTIFREFPFVAVYGIFNV